MLANMDANGLNVDAWVGSAYNSGYAWSQNGSAVDSSLYATGSPPNPTFSNALLISRAHSSPASPHGALVSQAIFMSSIHAICEEFP